MVEWLPGEDVAVCVRAPCFVGHRILMRPRGTCYAILILPHSPTNAVRDALSRIAMICLALVGVLVHAQAHSAQVTFQWDYPASAAAGFYLYCGTASRVYPTKVDVGNATTFTLAGLTEGATYYCAATAYDGARVESGYSNELLISVPYAAPVANFTMTPASGTAPLNVTFANTSTGATSYAWTFGDGATSTQPEPYAPVQRRWHLRGQAHGHRSGGQHHQDRLRHGERARTGGQLHDDTRERDGAAERGVRQHLHGRHQLCVDVRRRCHEHPAQRYAPV